MAERFELKELPPIDPGSESWRAVQAWAENELNRLRAKREDPDADQRKLDIGLGSIMTLKLLLKLPEEIRQERKREPVTSDGFGIPTPKGY